MKSKLIKFFDFLFADDDDQDTSSAQYQEQEDIILKRIRETSETRRLNEGESRYGTTELKP